jgi:hypothetical protein
VPTCQRGWSSLYDALTAGPMNAAALEQLVASSPLATETTWYAVDASVWPRGDAETSPERGYYPHPYRHSHGQPMVAGWNSSWLVQVPSCCSSWTAPVRVRRMRPGEHANLVAAEQIRSWRRQARPAATSSAALPIVSCDAGDDAVQLSLAVAGESVCLLVRLRAGRGFSADPTTPRSTGRPRRHGANFLGDDPTTWPAPTDQWATNDPRYGHVQLQAWRGLHPIPQPHASRGTRTQPPARPRVGRHPAPPRGRALAPPHQGAPTALVLVVGAGPARPGRGLASRRRPLLDRAQFPLLQTDPQVDHAEAAQAGGGRPLDVALAAGLCPVALGPQPGG